jgi:hypothetical protein
MAAGLVGPVAKAQEIDFQPLRYDDDLSVPQAEAEAGRPGIKALPVGEAGWLSLGGEVRIRLERASAPSLGRIAPGVDNYGLHRALLHANVDAGDGNRLFLQLGAFIAPGKDAASAPAEDRLDLQQAFFDIAIPASQGRAIVRLGRQEMALGSQRLVGLRDGPNARLNFDGARLIWRGENLTANVFALRPVEQRPGVFDNRTAKGASLSGIYATTPAPGPLKGNLDLYALRYERPDAAFASGSGREQRWSVGARIFGRHERWDWDLEATWQGGRLGPQNIAAWGFASDIGTTFTAGDWHLRLGAKVDVASGDRRPGGWRG